MGRTLWALPVASTALLEEAVFEMLAGRVCALSSEYEGEDDNVVRLRLLFEGVEAFTCTYHAACTPEMIETAYDKVVDLGETNWSGAIRERLAGQGQEAAWLKHLMIYFDDGPCYEFICLSFRVEENPAPSG